MKDKEEKIQAEVQKKYEEEMKRKEQEIQDLRKQL